MFCKRACRAPVGCYNIALEKGVPGRLSGFSYKGTQLAQGRDAAKEVLAPIRPSSSRWTRRCVRLSTPRRSHKSSAHAPPNPQDPSLRKLNTDLVIVCQRLPNPGETLVGGDSAAAGGKGANRAGSRRGPRRRPASPLLAPVETTISASSPPPAFAMRKWISGTLRVHEACRAASH